MLKVSFPNPFFLKMVVNFMISNNSVYLAFSSTLFAKYSIFVFTESAPATPPVVSRQASVAEVRFKIFLRVYYY